MSGSNQDQHFEEQQAELLPQRELPEWCGWFLPLVFLGCCGVGAVVITKWTIEALLWVINSG